MSLVAEKNIILVVCDRLFKMAHFVVIIKGTLVERLARLFRDNIWKLYKVPKSVISDRESQFKVELMKKLNRILDIETKLLTSFHLQMDKKTEYMNQELEQYLWFFVDHRQKD